MANLRAVVYGWQWVAPFFLPIVALLCVAQTAGGIPSGLAAIACVPAMVLLLIAPITGRAAGRMVSPDRVTSAYAGCTIAVWVTYAAFWAGLAGPPEVAVLLGAALGFAWFGQILAAAAARFAKPPGAGPGRDAGPSVR